MITVINNVVSWFSTIIGFIINLSIPNGSGGVIYIRDIVIFLFLTRLAWRVVHMILTSKTLVKGGSNGKD